MTSFIAITSVLAKWYFLININSFTLYKNIQNPYREFTNFVQFSPSPLLMCKFNVKTDGKHLHPVCALMSMKILWPICIFAAFKICSCSIQQHFINLVSSKYLLEQKHLEQKISCYNHFLWDCLVSKCCFVLLINRI